MRYSHTLVLAALASALTCGGPAHAGALDVRYYNPGSTTFDSLAFEVDGQPYVELPSGCPGPGDPVTGPICVAQVQLAEGVHRVRAKAFAQGDEPAWTVYSNTIEVQGVPEPPWLASLGLGGLWAGFLARRWREGRERAEAGLEAAVARLHDAPIEWYEGLSRAGRDRVDQTLHVLAGFGIASLGSAAAAWEWAHRREFIAQAPIERVGDTERDMRFMLYGAWGGQVVWTGWTTTVVVLLVT